MKFVSLVLVITPPNVLMFTTLELNDH